MRDKQTNGHIAALVTILVWGVTFISTKVLLEDFQPVEILFYRFLLGYAALWLIYPHSFRLANKKQELLFMAAGLCGICLYYLLENIALTMTLASNVGVIISIAPFFTAVITTFVMKQEARLHKNFYLGFIIAMIGISLISFYGGELELNPLGDLLAIGAALVWACYAVLTRMIGAYGYSTIATTRRTFFYGILFMMPALYFFEFQFDVTRFLHPINTINLLFLGLGASALCFITWNVAVKILGAVKTSVYIYLVPVITIVTSVLILQEPLTLTSCIGALFTIIGLCISQWKRS